jgi:hypothetical protein
LPDDLFHHVLDYLVPVDQVVILCTRTHSDHLLADLASSTGTALLSAVSDFIYYNRHELTPLSHAVFYESLPPMVRHQLKLPDVQVPRMTKFNYGKFRPCFTKFDYTKVAAVLSKHHQNRHRCLWKYLPPHFRDHYDEYFEDKIVNAEFLPSFKPADAQDDLAVDEVIDWDNPLGSEQMVPVSARLSHLITVFAPKDNTLTFFDPRRGLAATFKERARTRDGITQFVLFPDARVVFQYAENPKVPKLRVTPI